MPATNPQGFPGGQFPPGMPGQYPPGFPPPPAPGGRRNALPVVLCLVALLLSGVMSTLAFTLGGNDSGDVGAPKIEPPAEGEEPSTEYVEEKSDVLLDRSAEALLNKDKETWLEIYDGSVQDDMETRYKNLRELQVSFFEYDIIETPEKNSGQWTTQVSINYCFGGKKGEKCTPTGLVTEIDWSYEHEAGLLATSVSESKTPHHNDPEPDESDYYDTTLGVRPWEDSELTAKAGDRAIVAATDSAADDYPIDEALKIADAAAKNADKYAQFEKVDKYVVYLGDDEDISTWYLPEEDNREDGVLGYTIPLPQIDKDGKSVPGGTEVVFYAERVKELEEEEDFKNDDHEGFEVVMFHEFAHVATLYKAPAYPFDDITEEDANADWWLSEGVAELAEWDPETELSKDYLRYDDVKSYYKEWDKKLEYYGENSLFTSAMYGVAFYSSYYLWHEYGEDKFMDFFERVARNHEDLDDSSEEAFGKSYKAITKECAKFVKKQVK